jgi:hypothetical protein
MRKFTLALIVIAAALFVVSVVAARPDVSPHPFDSPLAEPEGPTTILTGSHMILVLIVKQTGQIMLSCGNDPDRGPLYRDLISYTINVLNPLAEWGTASCACGLSAAHAKGYAVGQVLGMGIAIIGRIFGLILDVIGSAVGLIGQIVTLMTGAATPPSVNCAGEAEGLCLGLAAIIALTETAGTFLTILTVIGVSILGFYLAIYMIKEIRAMIQPGDDSE